ncbi:MAG: bacterial Ig-like domain-containing protein [Corallococcus sp.]|nr:bacterial Ig-like domain-containing protein [Corallococcus sp.]
MKRKAVILSLIMIVALMCVLVGCNQPKITGIEITANPTKVTYNEGETFDAAGMVVSAVYDNDTKEAITDYTVDKTGALKTTDTKVTVSYGEFTAQVNITVYAKQVTVTDIKVDTSVKYVRTMDASAVVRYKAIYSDTSEDADWKPATAEDLESYEIKGDKIELVLNILAGTKEHKKTIQLDIADDQVVSVAELKTKTADGETQYIVEGTVVAVVNTMQRHEYILKDSTSEVYMGVSGFSTTGNINNGDYVAVFNKGDKVRIPVTLETVAAAAGADTDKLKIKSDDGKVLAMYKGGTLYETGIVEKDVQVVLDKASAIEITNQNQLREFLGAQNRAGNAYKVVKLTAPLYIVRYNNFYRFMFSGVNSYADQKIDGGNCSPIFAQGNALFNNGKTVGEMLKGDEEWNPLSYASPEATPKTVYALFAGGNTYYHTFTILDIEDFKQPEIKVEGTQKEYAIGDTFDFGTEAQLVCSYGKDAYGKDIVFGNPKSLSADMLDTSTIPDMTTAGKFTVKGICEGEEFQFEVTITKIPQAIQLQSEPANKELDYRTWQTNWKNLYIGLSLTVNYQNGSSETVEITEEMLSCEETAQSDKVTVTITYWGVTATSDFTVTLPQTMTSVTEIKTITEEGATEYNLNGIVVVSYFVSGTASNPSDGEILLKDKTNGNLIGVKNMGVSYSDKLAGLSVGDEIVVPVTMRVTNSTQACSEKFKVTAYKSDGCSVKVLSKGNDAALDKDSAITLSGQEDLEAFLAKNENNATRVGNMYKAVKFAAGTRFVNYKGSLYITCSKTATKLAEIKIDALTPFLSIMNQEMTLGDKTYGDLFVGEGQAISGDFTSPIILEKDVYMVYVGGQGTYYHHFVLLGAQYMVTPEPAQTPEITE